MRGRPAQGARGWGCTEPKTVKCSLSLPFSDVVLSTINKQGPTLLGLCLRQMESKKVVIQGEDPSHVVDEDRASLVDKLPLDVLVRVCGYLPVRERQRLRCVCKTLCQALDDPLLWKAITIDGFERSDYAD